MEVIAGDLKDVLAVDLQTSIVNIGKKGAVGNHKEYLAWLTMYKKL